MVIVRDRNSRWVEGNGMSAELKSGFRKVRRTEVNIFIMGRVIEMARMRK